jgi:P pilus assembly chaperone PapD
MLICYSGAIAMAAMLVCAATPASALLVQPIVMDLSTTGSNSSGAISIVNDRNGPDSVEVKVSKFTLPESGDPVLTPDDGADFLIFPPAATIEAGKTQVLRVRWIGEPALKQSQTYMFSVSELPVGQVQGSGVQILYSIQTLVTVTPPDLKPNLSIATAERTSHVPAGATTPAAVPGATVTFANDGNAIDYASHYQLTFSVAGSQWSKNFDGAEMSKAVGLGLVTPGGRRKIFFPIPDMPATGDISVKLEAPSKG